MDSESHRHHLIVPLCAAGQRLDRWLTEQFEDASRSTVQRWITDGQVLVNGERPTKNGLPLEADAQITVLKPALKETSLRPEEIPLDIIYEEIGRAHV